MALFKSNFRNNNFSKWEEVRVIGRRSFIILGTVGMGLPIATMTLMTNICFGLNVTANSIIITLFFAQIFAFLMGAIIWKSNETAYLKAKQISSSEMK